MKGFAKRIKSSKAGIVKTGVIVILVSLLLLTILLIIDIYVKEPTKPYNVIYNLLLNIFITGVTLGVGTIIYGVFDVVNFISERLREIILEYDFVKNLNEEQKNTLLKKIEKDLIYGTENIPENSLYDFVNNEVKHLTKYYFYEKMYISINCTVEDEYLVKTIIRKFTVNLNHDDSYKFDLKSITKCSFNEDENNKEPLVLNKLIINEEDFSDKTERKSIKSDNSCYDDSYYYTLKEGVEIPNACNSLIDVEMHYTTKVSTDDTTLSYRVQAPCKEFEASLVFDNNQIKADCDVFVFKDILTDQQCMDKNRISYIRNQNLINVKIDDWILPGDGVIYIFGKNN